MLQSMRSQRVGHDWVIELNWTKSYYILTVLEEKFLDLGILLSVKTSVCGL